MRTGDRAATLHGMTCTHCGRKLAGVAVIFPGKPAVCGRADCLGWARSVIMPVASALPVADPIDRLNDAQAAA